MKKSRFSLLLISLLMFGSFITAQGQSAPAQDDDKVYAQSEVDTKAVIRRKPRASTDGKCKSGSAGTTAFALILHHSGRVIIERVLQSSYCDVFDRNAVEAAKSIVFVPAVKDGKPVSVRSQVSYSYTMY